MSCLRPVPTLRPRFRVQCGHEADPGPGKADLPGLIERAGPLAAAMDMSCRHGLNCREAAEGPAGPGHPDQ